MTGIYSTEGVRLRTILGEHPHLLTFQMVQRRGASVERFACDVYFVPVSDRQIGDQELDAYLRGQGMSLSDVCFIDLSALTRRAGNAAAAVDVKSVLAESDEDGSIPTNLELLLAVFWAAALNGNGLRRGDNFLDLGHASQGVEVLTRIEAAFQFEVPRHLIWDHPTIADLARVLSAFASTRDLEADAAIVIAVLQEWFNRTVGASSTLDHFRRHGWVRIPAAFSADAAGAMRAVVWRALAAQGIQRDDPTTWSIERPNPKDLWHLRMDPAFRAVGTERTLAAIDETLGGQPWRAPTEWGFFFLVFPTGRPWEVPVDGWHVDADICGPLTPPRGVKVHAMFGDVPPRSGGMAIVSGSHRLVHQWFVEHPPSARARIAELRKSVHQHQYLRDLCSAEGAGTRVERFHNQVQVIDGIPLQILENTASAGDVILMHPLLLHAANRSHTGKEPRFLLNKDIYV